MITHHGVYCPVPGTSRLWTEETWTPEEPIRVVPVHFVSIDGILCEVPRGDELFQVFTEPVKPAVKLVQPTPCQRSTVVVESVVDPILAPPVDVVGPATDQSAAWAFVLARQRQIDRFAHKFFNKLENEADREDARSDFIARIVEQFPKFQKFSEVRNPVKLLSNWLGWQALAVQQTYRRSFKKRGREGTSDEKVLVTISCQGFGSHESVGSSLARQSVEATIERLFTMADERQREAMLAVLNEDDVSDPKAHRQALTDLGYWRRKPAPRQVSLFA